MFTSDDEHDAPKEPAGWSIRQEDDTANTNNSPRTNGDIWNDQDATSNAAKDKSHAEKEVQGTEQPEYTKRQIYATQASWTSPVLAVASSNVRLSSTASSFAAGTFDDVLGENSAASSIKRSFDLLNNIDLRINNVRDPSESFFFGSGMYTNVWSQEEKDRLIDFANKYIIRGSEKKEHDDCTKKRRTS
eukprot:CAMPEP_0201981558 /NCGR_PEP_ID=MMETSP0904-20121228/73909_1 /ASSEMBLY_ACC=CAM_ASM_000553 /TAXON_ID=420261 /ORGANISM="Thalassiosira antarctica, Strain CCMP982" /LENGTH=188 /DNA_ID=CAMNT_0048534153 /DNA_START=1 /DNA_END=567 /DNA_ORIENTATION=-